MAVTEGERIPTEAGYDLQGTRLEACSCGVLCPCWVGEDPDGGSCDALFAYHFDRGTVRGVDVSGLTLVVVTRIAGNNRTPGSWRIVVLVDEGASDDQLDAIVAAYSGQLGGPLADLAALVGEVVGVERAPIVHDVRDGEGTLRVGDAVTVETGSRVHTVDLPEHGMVWSFTGRNATQAAYRVSHGGRS
jgi:hypothetical protein